MINITNDTPIKDNDPPMTNKYLLEDEPCSVP